MPPGRLHEEGQGHRVPGHRHTDTWVASVPPHGVYGHGRTLRALHSNLTQGLALLGVATEITLVPVTPELDACGAPKLLTKRPCRTP
jgi:hypothetical protein